MKEELEKLGFEEFEDLYLAYKYSQYNYIMVTKSKDVVVGDVFSSNNQFLFPYNHEKLKQLIQLLS